MSAAAPESREVPVEILPPLPVDTATPGPTGTTVTAAKSKGPFAGADNFYHPASGVVILGLDWLIFGTDLMTGFLALPVMCVLAFCFSFMLLIAIQRKWAGNSLPTAAWKAALGAFLVAIPLPITGTLLGAAILTLSGLPHHPVEMVRRLAASRSLKN
jgi:hypothetical protein